MANGLCLSALPAAAAGFDGRWFADIPATQGCAGNGASTVTLLVAGHDVQGRVDNVREREGVAGSIDDSGYGRITVARQLEGAVQFDGDHFTLQWTGKAGCARHAEGDRALEPAQQAAVAAERSRHQALLADLIRRTEAGEKIDYARLQAEYVYSADWDFYDRQLGTLVERADAAAKGGDCAQALSLVALALKADFIVNAAHAVRADCLKSRDPAGAAIEQAIADGLIHSLMDSGDGATQARAYVVSTQREDNDVLANRKIVLKARQERVRGSDGHYYDVVQGVTGDKEPVTKALYFDVGSFMTGRESKRAAATIPSIVIDDPPAPASAAGGQTHAACGFTLGQVLFDKWQTVRGGGLLGYPLNSESEAGRSPQGTSGRWAQFQPGPAGGTPAYIIVATSGPQAGTAHWVHGCVYNLYSSQGSTGGALGFPLSDEYDIPGGIRADFEGGAVQWDSAADRCTANIKSANRR